MSNQPQERKLLDNLKDYWPLIIFVGLVIVAWANIKSQVDQNTNRISQLEIEIRANNVTFLQLQKDIVEIKTTLEFIRKQITP